MRRKHSRRTTGKAMVEINVVPYIDVMLVLLVIFMITAPMLTQGVKVDLPQAQAQKIPPTDQKPLIVTVNQQGQYFLNRNNENTALTAAQLTSIISTTLSQDKGKQVYVRGDKNASYGQVVEAMVLLQKAGVASVGLVTDDSQR
ncbi:protein TolR [Fastidiosibacter lacustris]|uniref:protein TolR n=1 Tax=Fastidiosibacter lacustris TaxID=2056695 RepID=UPI001EFDE0FB|nr:protein TolR [Fastidiosibacter lacustris]